MNGPSTQLGELWLVDQQVGGGHLLLIAAVDPEAEELHAFLCVNRPAGPEDVVLTAESIYWYDGDEGVIFPVRAIACRRSVIISRDWLDSTGVVVGRLEPDELDAVGWLSAPSPSREGLQKPNPALIGSNYDADFSDPRFDAVCNEAGVVRRLTELARAMK